jgi:hypothetical protein
MSYKILASLLFIVAVLKIISGLMVLMKMRYNLNFHYHKKKWSIRVTIMLSCFVTLWKSFYSLFQVIRENDIKFSFVALDTINPLSLPGQIIVCLVDILAPVAVIAINIRTVNFVRYIKDLMSG